MESLIEQIKHHEGYRAKVYKCTEGYDTIGYGFAIKDLDLTEEVCDIILKEKIIKLYQEASRRFKFFSKLPVELQDVILNMGYQMGLGTVAKFKLSMKAFENKDWEEAANQMLDSKWAKQTPNRAKELADIVRNFND